MLNDSVLKVSSNGSFKVSQLCKSVAICEATKSDRYNWGNAIDDEPAFLVYFGCDQRRSPYRARVAGYRKDFRIFYRCESEVRKPKYLKNFEAEIKIRGMQRYIDTYAYGLDYLVESQSCKYGIDFDEYNYYTTGHQPRW